MRQCGDQLQRCRERHPGAPDMRVDPHSERIRHIGDLLALREAAGGADVGLRDIEQPLDEQWPETPAGELGLTAGDRDR